MEVSIFKIFQTDFSIGELIRLINFNAGIIHANLRQRIFWTLNKILLTF